MDTAVPSVVRDQPDLLRLRQAVDASGEIVFMTGCDGIFTFVNPAFERLYGYPASAVVGRVTPRILNGGRAPVEQDAALWRQLTEGQTVERSFINQTKDGVLLEIEATLRPLWDESGTIVGFLAVQRDVTASRRAVQELRAQQGALSIERELGLDGILVMDDRSRVLSYNRRFADMWGLSTDRFEPRQDVVLLQTVVSQFADPARSLERVHEFYSRNDEVTHDEVALADGRIFDRYCAPTSGPDGEYSGRVWYFRDVTETKRAEANLRQERDRAQSYLDVADVILMVLDLEGRVRLINRKGCSLLEREEAELLGQDWLEMCVPVQAHAIVRAGLTKLQLGVESIIENPIVKKSGEQRLILWHNTVLSNQHGGVIGTLSSGTDITDRHQAAEMVRTAEERMRFALQNADVGIWDMDYKTGVLQWSETLEAQYGLKSGTFAGTTEAFIAHVHPGDRVAVLETFGRAMKSGNDFSVLNRTIWPNGTVRWLSGAGRVQLGESGEPIRGVGISMDITDRKKLELELLHAQKLESVGRLAAGVAHEINTPVQFVSDSIHFIQEALTGLTSVLAKYKTVAELVCADVPARLAAEAAAQSEVDLDLGYILANVPAALDRSIEGLNRVTVIVRSMKEFAHPGRAEMAPLDLNRAIQSTLTIARSEYKYVADVETDFGDIPLVSCHGGDVNQVFLNIIVNAAHAIGDAIKGTTGRGRITIQTRLDGDAVEVRIGDSGGGIPEAIRNRVFDPFFTTKEVGKGTGQGLSMARSMIVDKHGGELTFETAIDRGTTFIIRLPVSRHRDGVADRASIPTAVH